MSFSVECDDTPDTLHGRSVYTCKTRDNFSLTLQRCFSYTIDGSIAPPVYNHSVILCHGFASNRFTFDLNPDVSVPNHLTDKGWDVWLMELRGSGKNHDIGGESTVGSDFGAGEHRHDWCFDDHVEDCRAIIEYVHSITGRPTHVVGHSMGAMLLQCCAGGESGSKKLIRSGVSIAGCVVMESSHWTYFKWLWPIVQHFGTIHPEYIQTVLAPLSFRFDSPWDELFFHQNNVDTAIARDMFRKNWTSISVALIDQLRYCLEPVGICKKDGTQYSKTLKSIKAPMLMIAGSLDEQCHPICMENLNKLIAGVSVYKLIGKKSGHKDDYGHFDLIVGKNAKTEVWDMVCRFLEKHDSIV